jgi:hypothetical protein
MASRQRDDSRSRILLTQECARIMTDEGVKDFLAAKRKAAARLHITNKALLPSNAEIEQALADYQRLFRAPHQAARLLVLREAALAAMRFLQPFDPKLVGPVLTGMADLHSDVNLHVFADTPEEVLLFLMENNIPAEASERRQRFGTGEYVYLPLFSFAAGDVTIELTIFLRGVEREAPRSPVDGKPMRRAGLAELMLLLEQDRAAADTSFSQHRRG